MSKYNSFITSELNGLLYINGKCFCEILKNYKPIELELEINNSLIFSFYPIELKISNTNKCLPYSFKISNDSNNLPIINCNYVDYVIYNDSYLDIILKDNYITLCDKCVILNSSNKEFNNLKIIYKPNNLGIIKIMQNDKEYIFDCKHCISNISYKELFIESKLYIFLYGQVEKYDYIRLFHITDTEIKQIAEILADNIELIDNKINVLIKKYDMFKHAVVTKYLIKEEKIVLLEKFLTSLNNEPLIINPNLIPFAFLEAIRVENYEFARKYLSKELSDGLTNKHLKNYFDKYIDIKQPHFDCEKCVALIYATEQNNKFIAKYYKFCVKNDLIENIDLIID